MSYFPTDIPFMSDDELIENGLKKPYKKPEIIDGKDIVPVVRCKDCRCWNNGNVIIGCYWDIDGGQPGEMDFCSRGKRKE